jgi:hypothetical protein
LVLILVLVGGGFGIARLVSGGGGRTATGSRSSPNQSTTTSTTLPPPAEPGGGRRLFPSHRIVAFYGAPGGGALGVLGATDPAQAWQALRTQAAPYAQPGVHLTLAFELVAYVAQANPGPSGTYTARLSDHEIQAYLNVVKAHHGMLILDIQPGRSSFLTDAKSLAPYLDQPDVGLALDPEWQVAPPAVPGQVIGQTTAADINKVGSWLSALTRTHRLPQKLFLIHQFTPSMILDKSAVRGWYHLSTTFNMDGFGGWANKVSVYQSLAADPRWPLGFKLFYSRDTPLYPPSAVLQLHPIPSIIEYE